MSPFMEMEWDLDNLVLFGSKVNESPKKMQLADWTLVDDAEMHTGSFNLSGGSDFSGVSGSDGSRHCSSAASTGGSCKKTEMKGIELCGTSPALQAEAVLGLKLGKRMYFENVTGVNKKSKSSGQTCCQVERCTVDLSVAKEYHRKHRVCDHHSKCPKVIVGGRERRFCQQCSRFHNLSEFDESKRSCRRRLSDHNARRRKPLQQTIPSNFPRPSAPFYGGMNWNNSVTKGMKAINMQNGSFASLGAIEIEYGGALSLLSNNSSWTCPSPNAAPALYHHHFYSNPFN